MKNNNTKWKIVRSIWDDIIEKNEFIKLKKKVDDKMLWEYLFSDEFSDEDEIRSIINEFLLQ